jgi:transposase
MARVYTEEEVRQLMEEATAPLAARIAELEAELARLKKDSSTSSKPPSSDIVKPPRSTGKSGRKRKHRPGGQPGHKRHSRPPFPPDEVDRTWVYEWTECDNDWKPLEQFRVIQQVELPERLLEVTEHRARMYQHRKTGRIAIAELPPEVLRGGLLGPRLMALVGYQKGACHMSYRLIQRFFSDVLDLPISTGELVKAVSKVGTSLDGCYRQLEAALPQARRLNIDETGHPECGKQLWNWGFHAPGREGFTWFHIDTTRSAKVLTLFLGETFSGIVGCDYHSAYRKFLHETDAKMQFCWAHLIRDVKFLTTLSDRVTRAFGERLLAKIKALFRLWHRRETMSAPTWSRAAERARRNVRQAALRAPRRAEAQNIAARFRQHAKYYFTFLDTAGVEPTNNAMERGFRQVVIDRKVTQGTRGTAGRQWCERIWTVLATCSQQGHSAYRFIHQSVLAHLQRHLTPALLPLPP